MAELTNDELTGQGGSTIQLLYADKLVNMSNFPLIYSSLFTVDLVENVGSHQIIGMSFPCMKLKCLQVM